MATADDRLTRPRRFFELLLLLALLAVGIGGWRTDCASTGRSASSESPNTSESSAISLIAKLGIRFLAPYPDPVILPIAVALTGLGS